MRKFVAVGSLALAISLASIAPAQTKNLAFVVGVDRYENLDALRQLDRPVADAKAVAVTLKELGYDVTSALNVGRATFFEQWQRFTDAIEAGDNVTVFMAGHGVQIDGKNYLLPADVPDIARDRQVRIERSGISADELQIDIASRRPRVTVLILDACRDNPLAPQGARSVGGKAGLALMAPVSGTFIMYSAADGGNALDQLSPSDVDPNSVFTRKLLPLMRMRGLSIRDLAYRLRREVREAALSVGQSQQPTYYDNLDGEFCFAGCDTEKLVVAPAPDAVAANNQLLDRIHKSDSVEELQKFIAETPQGSAFLSFAQARVVQIKMIEHGQRFEAIKDTSSIPPLTLYREKHAIDDVYRKWADDRIKMLQQAALQKEPSKPTTLRELKGRYAFVVGVSDYKNFDEKRQLPRAIKDAAAVSAALRGVGFEVKTGDPNATREKFNELLQDFVDSLISGDEVVFYFSGHGLQIEGQSYLLPSNMPRVPRDKPLQLREGSINASSVLSDIAKRQPRVLIAILDACRENPFAVGWKSESAPNGMAALTPPKGTFVMYSASDNEVAYELLANAPPGHVSPQNFKDSDENSVYTRMLLKHIGEKGLEIDQLAKLVGRDVEALTDGQQSPRYYSGMSNRAAPFCFAGCKP